MHKHFPQGSVGTASQWLSVLFPQIAPPGRRLRCAHSLFSLPLLTLRWAPPSPRSHCSAFPWGAKPLKPQPRGNSKGWCRDSGREEPDCLQFSVFSRIEGQPVDTGSDFRWRAAMQLGAHRSQGCGTPSSTALAELPFLFILVKTCYCLRLWEWNPF